MSRRSILFAVLIACLCVPVLAACQSADSGTKEAGSSANLKGTQLTDQDVKLAASYTGGAPGKATKSPIRIGYIKVTSGAAVFDPDSVPATVKMINERLGGIQGHPIQLVPCELGSSESQAQQCGQKFRSDSTIDAVMDPSLPDGGLALFGSLNGAKPTFCATPFQPELIATNVYCINGGILSSPTFVTYLKDYTDATKIATVVPDDATFRQIGALNEKSYKQAGMKSATTAYIPKGTPDISAPLIAAGVKNADAIVVTVPNDSQCIAVVQALKSLGVSDKVPVIGLPTCADAAVRKALGGDIPKWTYYDLGPSPVALDSPEITVFKNTVETYDNGESQLFANTRFSATMWMAKVLNQVGADNLSPASISKAAKAYTGPVFMGYPNIKFGQHPFPNAGTMKSRFFNYLGSDKWEDATDGKWVDMPAPVVEK